MFVIDTDHLSILQDPKKFGYRNIVNRMAQHDPSDFYITIVTVHEQFLGGHEWIQRARTNDQFIEGYRYLERAVSDAGRFKVLPLDEPALRLCQQLRMVVRRIGIMDLRIASIALSHNMTVLTRNARDFELIPQLQIEDWTR